MKGHMEKPFGLSILGGSQAFPGSPHLGPMVVSEVTASSPHLPHLTPRGPAQTRPHEISDSSGEDRDRQGN